MLVPFGNRILVQIAPQSTTDGGIILPDSFKQSGPDMATVVAISPEADTKGRFEVGSKVVVVRSIASKTDDDGMKNCIIDVDDILAIEE